MAITPIEVDGIVIGNVYNKYNSRNPIARKLLAGYLRAVTDLYREVGAKSVLEVGCGEGYLAAHLLAAGPRPQRFAACDLTLEQVQPGIDPLIQFQVASAYELPFRDNEFELVLCCEVLEHLDDPRQALAELRRVAGEAVLVSTPREPVWRVLNMARCRYLSRFGNTPGHVQHFSREKLQRLVGEYLQIGQVLSPLPWTVVLGQTSTAAGNGRGVAAKFPK